MGGVLENFADAPSHILFFSLTPCTYFIFHGPPPPVHILIFSRTPPPHIFNLFSIPPSLRISNGITLTGPLGHLCNYMLTRPLGHYFGKHFCDCSLIFSTFLSSASRITLFFRMSVYILHT